MTPTLQQISGAALDPGVLRAVDRACADLRRGELLLLTDGEGGAVLVQAAEGVSAASLARLRLLGDAEPQLLLTRQRASRLGLAEAGTARTGHSEEEVVVALATTGLRAEAVAELADPVARGPFIRALDAAPSWPAPVPPHRLAQAAVALAKIARLLPAVVLAPLARGTAAGDYAPTHDLLAVPAAAVEAYGLYAARSLGRVAEARVPLAAAENTRVVAFRPADGGVEHLAIVVGEPQPGTAVLTRLHSECFTGDLLGSLRCDCGDQLRGAIQVIAEAGSGVLLYLAQEGRGIGLVNKLRAYNLQDQGADTFEANEQLGFDADERVYLPAAEMLRQLGFPRIRLLTNNPAKVAALQRCGISVVERVPHSFPSNGHNEFYLATKAGRGGHLF